MGNLNNIFEMNGMKSPWETPQEDLEPNNKEKEAALSPDQTTEQTPKKGKGNYHIFGFDEAVKNLRPTEWLIKDVLPAHGLIFMFGASGSGKSLIALDMLKTINTRTCEQWQGHKVYHAPVLYLCGEGYDGFLKRCLAWDEVHDTPAASDALILSPTGEHTDLDSLTDEVKELIADIQDAMEARKIEEFGLMVIDTLSQYLKGDENDRTAAHAFIDTCAAIAKAIKAKAIMIITHTGVALEAQNRMRGSSAFKAAADWEYKVSTTKDRYLVDGMGNRVSLDIMGGEIPQGMRQRTDTYCRLSATKIKDGMGMEDLYVQIYGHTLQGVPLDDEGSPSYAPVPKYLKNSDVPAEALKKLDPELYKETEPKKEKEAKTNNKGKEACSASPSVLPPAMIEAVKSAIVAIAVKTGKPSASISVKHKDIVAKLQENDQNMSKEELTTCIKHLKKEKELSDGMKANTYITSGELDHRIRMEIEKAAKEGQQIKF